jgi:hypothetical protein
MNASVREAIFRNGDPLGVVLAWKAGAKPNLVKGKTL